MTGRRGFLLGVLAVLLSGTASAKWAVLVAGSNGYGNYRHQADICHAYHTLVDQGFNSSQIITMIYDDVAGDGSNPFPGQLYNRPNATGTSRDVYKGCNVTYRGEDVTAANFLAVLSGNQSAVTIAPGTRSRPEVLRSTAKDEVFVVFSDHGASGLVAMPAGPFLYADALSATFKSMHARKMYRKLAFYLEACESGSMCAGGLVSNNTGVFCETASNPDESSWGTYCPPDDVVNGTSIDACLGDLYSVNWMENSDGKAHGGPRESLLEQYIRVQQATNLSHVMKYGDSSFVHWKIGVFQGNMTAPRNSAQHNYLRPVSAEGRRLQEGQESGADADFDAAAAMPPQPRTEQSVSARLATFRSLELRLAKARAGGYDSASSAKAADLAAQLDHELYQAAVYDRAFTHVASTIAGADTVEVALLIPLGPIAYFDCYRAANDQTLASCGAVTDYTLRYLRLNAYACQRLQGNAETAVAIAKDACAKGVSETKTLGPLTTVPTNA